MYNQLRPHFDDFIYVLALTCLIRYIYVRNLQLQNNVIY